jgi:hypothetical protein
MKLLALAIGLFGAVTLSDVCNAQIFDNPFAEYVERGVTINPSAGNANAANAAVQTIDPWPPYVGHTRIPGNGREAVGAVGRMYAKPSPYAQSQGQGGGAGGGTGIAPQGGTGIGGGAPPY